MRILIADSNSDVREVVAGFCGAISKGVEAVLMARDSAEAIRWASDLSVDVVVIDNDLPRLGGIKTADLLRKRGFKGKIITTGGCSRSPGKRRFAHLSKPFNLHEFLSVVLDRSPGSIAQGS